MTAPSGLAQNLARHEVIIERGLAIFVEVGNALVAVRDGRLYRAQFPTFEAYCSARWGLTHRRVNQIIGASAVGTIVPVQNEAQARVLAPYKDEPEVMQQVMDRANEISDGRPTAATLQQARDEIRPRGRSAFRDKTTTDLINRTAVAMAAEGSGLRMLADEVSRRREAVDVAARDALLAVLRETRRELGALYRLVEQHPVFVDADRAEEQAS